MRFFSFKYGMYDSMYSSNDPSMSDSTKSVAVVVLVISDYQGNMLHAANIIH
jgi:hypothetical protein